MKIKLPFCAVLLSVLCGCQDETNAPLPTNGAPRWSVDCINPTALGQPPVYIIRDSDNRTEYVMVEKGFIIRADHTYHSAEKP